MVIKGINREVNDPIAPAFLLKVMVLDLVIEPIRRHRDGMKCFLAWAIDRIAENWRDPAGTGPDVNRATPAWKRQQLSSKVNDRLNAVEEVLLLEYEEKGHASVDKWRELFGWRKPRP